MSPTKRGRPGAQELGPKKGRYHPAFTAVTNRWPKPYPFKLAETDTFTAGSGVGRGRLFWNSEWQIHTSITRSSWRKSVTHIPGFLLVMTNEAKEKTLPNCRYLLCAPTMPLTRSTALGVSKPQFPLLGNRHGVAEKISWQSNRF